MSQSIETSIETTKYLTKAEVWMRVAAQMAGNFQSNCTPIASVIEIADIIADAWEERFGEEDDNS